MLNVPDASLSHRALPSPSLEKLIFKATKIGFARGNWPIFLPFLRVMRSGLWDIFWKIDQVSVGSRWYRDDSDSSYAWRMRSKWFRCFQEVTRWALDGQGRSVACSFSVNASFQVNQVISGWIRCSGDFHTRCQVTTGGLLCMGMIGGCTFLKSCSWWLAFLF